MALAIPIGHKLAALYSLGECRERISNPVFCQGCSSLETSWDMETHTIMGVLQRCVSYDFIALGDDADKYPVLVDLYLGLARNTADGPKIIPLTEWSIRLGFDDDDDEEGDWWGIIRRSPRRNAPLTALYQSIAVKRVEHIVIRELLIDIPHEDCLAEVE